MGKGNIVYHNLRMNLDNEQHRRVHSVLAELNTDVHKSVNQFLIDAADSYISRLAGNELTKESEQTGECLYVRREELEQIRREIKDELQREVIVTLGTALAGGKVIQIPQTVPGRAVAEQMDREIETEADETTLGLASSWG
ncbi:MAG: hypothetical protein J6A77_08560 [Lachnospiraceae bacterium]|jgi:hypothetical protein|nr:hypothetical protein [Lachnospiraceae bacterium]